MWDLRRTFDVICGKVFSEPEDFSDRPFLCQVKSKKTSRSIITLIRAVVQNELKGERRALAELLLRAVAAQAMLLCSGPSWSRVEENHVREIEQLVDALSCSQPLLTLGRQVRQSGNYQYTVTGVNSYLYR